MHAPVRRPANQGIGGAVLGCFSDIIQDGVPGNEVLQLHLHLGGDLELPIVWFLAEAWNVLWESRKLGRRPGLYKVRSDLEAKVSLPRETRQYKASDQIRSVLNYKCGNAVT